MKVDADNRAFERNYFSERLQKEGFTGFAGWSCYARLWEVNLFLQKEMKLVKCEGSEEIN